MMRPRTSRSSRAWRSLWALLILATVTCGIEAQSDDIQVEGPVFRPRVEPQVLTMNMQQLTLAAPMPVWQPGDPIRVVEDLKERLAPSTASRSTQEDGDGPMVREPVTPEVFDEDASALPGQAAAAPGSAVRVAPDMQLSGPQGGGTAAGGAAGGTSADGGGAAPPMAGVNFDGIPATGSIPPDTNGDVGPNHYIQMVNTAFAIYDKQGNLLAGPSPVNSLWAGFGGACERQNNGDPIVRYDHLADRWLLSQFALNDPNGGHHECIAISRGPDPVADGYFLYDFPTIDAAGAPVFPDYPKIAVWPDGYYMGTQRGFPNGGLDVWAFERDQMLTGAPAGLVQFAVPRPSLFLLPSDLDGPPPPAGTPNFFGRQVDGQAFGGNDRVELFAFDVDWNNPMASSFVQIASLPTLPFDSNLCGGGLISPCVPQPGTNQRLETLPVWPMWRLQYRNFGSHEGMVFNHTVDANGNDLAGVRWYELRRPPAGAWSIEQQATYAPDKVHRWMGSAAMDQSGNIAIGYSAGGPEVFAGIRASTRLASDPPGTLGSEQVLMAGAGAQTHSSGRWGNYSAMDVDPIDDCTFWYTTEYYQQTSTGGWRTRIASFRIPSCGPTETYSYAAKVVCGPQPDPENMMLARGFYATTVNIHNPHREKTTFFKKLALTFPPKEQRPGKILPIATDTLGPDQALKVDCDDLRRRLFPGGFPTRYIEGFVVLEGDKPLDVTAVYSTAVLDRNGRVSDHSGIDVERIEGRKIVVAPTPPPPEEEKCADLVVRDISSPDVSCPTGGGSCVTKVEVTVANIGGGAAGPFSVRADIDPGVSVTRVVGGLAAGASTVVPFQTPPGGNCFNPDCTITATADSQQQIRECDEANNTASETTLG